MNQTILPRLAVSTWSLHHHLGAPPITGPENGGSRADSRKLLELPAQLAASGFEMLEICHFHLPVWDETFGLELSNELERNKIQVHALLIDGGDLNDSQNASRDQKWMESHLEIAAQLGAKTARVIAGKGAPTPQNLAQSVAALRELSAIATKNEVKLTIENWFDLTSTPAAVRQILESVDDLGLCLDFGNWGGPTSFEKHELLRQIAPLAASCHTKAFFKEGQIEREDFEKCLQMMREVDFSGVHTLIYDAGGDEWRGLEIEREVVAPFLG